MCKRRDIRKMSAKGITGLTNIGNTCYGNAVIQALRHQVDFTIFLLEGKEKEILSRKEGSEKKRMLESYVELVNELWKGNDKGAGSAGVANTRSFWSSMIPCAIKAGVEHFRIPTAHDAHEFLVFLLDQFHEALSEEVSMVVKVDGRKKHIHDALEFWKKTFENSYSPLVELIFGLQRKAICCEECKKESVSWETANMWKVSVPRQTESQPLELLDLMKHEFASEEIEEYSCDGCKPAKTKATISQSMWRFGNWVTIVLKRNENSGRRINTQVNIPLTLSFGSLFHTASQERSGKDIYELFATIHHHGSAGGGHYTSQARHPVSKKWFHYDDESARDIDAPMLDASTYIVMYRSSA
jgi:ubiquitin carboxyl-terminal hydrolase 8